MPTIHGIRVYCLARFNFVSNMCGRAWVWLVDMLLVQSCTINLANMNVPFLHTFHLVLGIATLHSLLSFYNLCITIGKGSLGIANVVSQR